MKLSHRESERSSGVKSSLVQQLNRGIVYAETVIARALVFISYAVSFSIVPAFAVAVVFKSSGYTVRRNPKTYRDHPLDDGTARYDDVWGG